MLFITIITLIVAKALPALNTQITSSHFSRLTSMSLIFCGLISLNSLNLETIGSGIGIYSGLFHITQISQMFEIFIFFIGSFILMGWYHPVSLGLTFGSQKAEAGKNIQDYSLIVLFSILGSSLLIISFDLISIYLSIELQSFGLYVLASLYKDSSAATSSGLKYFLLGGLSSCIILLGIGLIYSYTGLTNLESLYLINSVSAPISSVGASSLSTVNYSLEGLSLGLILIFIGFLFKIAASPLHNWSPDVYDGTPTIVTSWLTIIPKISILILLLELQIQLGSADAMLGGLKTLILSNSGYLYPEISQMYNTHPLATPIESVAVIKSLLLISSVLSLIIGSLLGLAQLRIKRLLAYSTISHIGFLLLALAINTEQSIDSFLFYIIQYTITNLNIFLIILAFTYLISPSSAFAFAKAGAKVNNSANVVGSKGGLRGLTDIRYIYEFKGLFFSNPFLSLSLAVSLFSMAGIPPLIGFFSKQFVLYSAIQNGYFFISILAIIVSVISASYYLKIVKVLIEPTSAPREGEDVTNVAVDTNFPLEPFASAFSEAKAEGQSDWLSNMPQKEVVETGSVELSNIHSYLISILTLSILFFFMKPSIILNSSKLLTLSLFSI